MGRAIEHHDQCSRCGHSQTAGLSYCQHCGLPLYARPTGWRPKTWWPWTRWFVLHKVLHVDDTPHRIALGLALGMFISLLPLVGLQMILTVVLAWALRANKVVGLPMAWVTNPVTIPPIYYFNYRVGAVLLGCRDKTMADFAIQPGPWIETLKVWRTVLVEVFWQCWLGSIVVGAVAGALTYWIGYWAVVTYRARHRRWFPDCRFDEWGRPTSSRGDRPAAE